MVSALYCILSHVYLCFICNIYMNFIFPCSSYPCFVVCTFYLIISHFNYSYVETDAHFCNAVNL